MDLRELANIIYEAEINKEQITAITKLYPEMTMDEAYRVQFINVERRKESGESLKGMKVGLTSVAAQKNFGVNEPIYGHLFEKMLAKDGECFSMSGLKQPLVEGELTFCLAQELQGPGVSDKDVIAATEYIVPSIEIVDTRYLGKDVTLIDTVADNSSSTFLVLGSQKISPNFLDMQTTGMILDKNGALINSGAAAVVMGSPAKAVAWLANALAEYNLSLPKGCLITSGAFTAAQNAQAGDIFSVSFTGMEPVTVSFTK